MGSGKEKTREDDRGVDDDDEHPPGGGDDGEATTTGGADERNHYEVLGVDPKKSRPSVLKRAYKKKAMRHHPDRVPPDQRAAATSEFQKIREAFEVLSDIRQKMRYDADHGIDKRATNRRTTDGDGGGDGDGRDKRTNQKDRGRYGDGAKTGDAGRGGDGKNHDGNDEETANPSNWRNPNETRGGPRHGRKKRGEHDEANQPQHYDEYTKEYADQNPANVTTRIPTDMDCPCSRMMNLWDAVKAGVIVAVIVIIALMITK